jgi:hypothetical protein
MKVSKSSAYALHSMMFIIGHRTNCRLQFPPSPKQSVSFPVNLPVSIIMVLKCVSIDARCVYIAKHLEK